MYQLEINLHTHIKAQNKSKTYKTEAIAEDGKMIADALYGIIFDHSEKLAKVIEHEINSWLESGHTEGSIHGSTYNAEWKLKEI